MKDASTSASLGRPARAAIAAMAFSAAALLAQPAQGSPEYPGALRTAAGMSCVPQCPVCHTTNPGRSGTALQPFALAMRKEGLLAGSPALVAQSFEKLKTETDPMYSASFAAMAESLSNDYDPNTGQLACGPTYGCGAHLAKAPPKRFGVFAWALGAVALVVSVRSVRSKRH